MRKKKKSMAFWKNIKFKYKLTITDENTLEEMLSLRLSKLNGISILLTTLVFLFTIAAIIIAFTPLRNYLPGYMNSEVRALVIENTLRADSLLEAVQKQNLYIMNIQDIFHGRIQADSIHSIDSLTLLREDSLMQRTQHETEWRKQYEEREKYNLNDLGTRSAIEGLSFYCPTRGMVATHFDVDKQHYGVDIVVPEGSSIQATLDGTVILNTYTADFGYVIALQHNQELISIYKKCGSLLKQIGESVKAGEAIALVGKNNNDELGSHLHFEMWRKGKAINPENYIAF